MGAALKGAFRAGRLTKDPVRVKQWVGAVLVQQMVHALIQNAHETGTFNWDVVWSRATSLLWLAALQARSGDICKGPWAEDALRSYLCWGDIGLSLSSGSSSEYLEGEVRVLLRGEKGHKCVRFWISPDNADVLTSRVDPKAARTVELRTLQGSNESCPITMLIVLALRTEAIEYETLESFLDDARKRPGERIQWTHPDRPVFAAINPLGLTLVLTKPAPAPQLADTITKAARLSGKGKALVPHDLRRGVAKDAKKMNQINPQVDCSVSVGQSLGHSRMAINLGVTDRYGEKVTSDPWTARVTGATTKST